MYSSSNIEIYPCANIGRYAWAKMGQMTQIFKAENLLNIVLFCLTHCDTRRAPWD